MRITKADLIKSMQAFAVPGHLRDGLALYFLSGVEPGGFLQSVLTNDLSGAVRRADRQSSAGFVELVRWLISEAPDRAWGSDERYHDWVSVNGLEGTASEDD